MTAGSDLGRWLPGLGVARSYRADWLAGDLVAGLVLTALLVPQGMAYAELAGLPAVTGLYTTVVGLIAYAVFGPSRILVLGPDSSLGPLIAATVVSVIAVGSDPADRVGAAGVLALMMGAICIGAGLARLGAVTELLSKPVRVGYLNGLAIVVLVSQLPKLLGFSVDATSTLEELADFITGVADGETNGTALAIGSGCLVIILGLRVRWPRIPGVLIAVAGATIAVVAFGLEDRGVAVVGEVPEGFPRPSIPNVDSGQLGELALAALGIAFVTVADTSALARAFSGREGERVDPNQEIVALGVANISVGFFQGFPLSASSSRTAVAKTAGAHSQLVGIVGAAAIVVLLVWANGLTASMPSAALAAIVIAAAFSLFDLGELRWLWRVRRSEFVLCTATILGVVVLGVLEGIVVAIALSLGNFIRRAWRPHDALLGRLAQRKGYHDLVRHPDGRSIPGLVIYRFDAPLFFANADYFARRLRAVIAERPEPVRWLIVAAEPMTDIDTTGAEILAEIDEELAVSATTLVFAELKGPVRDRLIHYGLDEMVAEGRLYPTVGTAVSGYLAATGVDWQDPLDR